jgi:hypothetical protein
VGYGNVPDSEYTQGSLELNTSAGPCRAGSLADAQGQVVAPLPPARLSATLSDMFLALHTSKFYFRSESPSTKKFVPFYYI